MSLDLTRQSLLTNILYIFLLTAVFWGSWIIFPGHKVPDVLVIDSGTSIGNWIAQYIVNTPILGLLASSVLMFLNSISVTQLCIRNVLFLERSYMPSMIYVIVSAGYFNSLLSFRYLIVSTLVLMAVSLIFRSFNLKTIATGTYLKVGFYFGLSAVIAPASILLSPLLFVGLKIFRTFNLKEWTAATVGFTLPILFAAYLEWLMGVVYYESAPVFTDFFVNFAAGLLTSDARPPSFTGLNILELGFILTLFVLIIFSVAKFILTQKAYNQKAFKAYLFFIWMLFFSILTLTILPCRSLNMLPIIATPLAMIIPIYFNASRPSFMMNFLYMLLILATIALHIIPLILQN